MFCSTAFFAVHLFFIVNFAACRVNGLSKVGIPHNAAFNQHQVDSKATFNIMIHGILLWASMGFLMPLGILTVRMSTTKDCSQLRHKALFYLHATLQVFSVLLATAAAVLSVKNFENAFSNIHQRIGLGLYVGIYMQILISFRRPKRGTKGRTVWYFLHWMLGTTISLVGAFNIYTGLDAYGKKTARSTALCTGIFTAQVCMMAILYMVQDKWEYMKKQGVVAREDESEISSKVDDDRKGIFLNDPSRKSNALGTYFSRTNALNKLFQLT